MLRDVGARVSNSRETTGYGNQEDRIVLGNAIAGIENGQFGTFMGFADPSKRPTIADAMKPIEESLAVDPTADVRRTELAKDISDTGKSIGAPALYDAAKKRAFYKLRLEGKTSGEYEDSNKNNLYQGLMVDEVQREAFDAAKKVGVDTSKYGEIASDLDHWVSDNTVGSGVNRGVLGGNPLYRTMYSEKTRAEKYAELRGEIGQAGGKVGGVEEMVGYMKRLVELAEKQENQRLGKPAPAPGAPPVLPAAPPGRPPRI